MNTRSIDCAFHLKTISDAGVFEGYGSVFNVLDSFDEIVAPGAFTESLAKAASTGIMPSMLWQHRSAEPIGVYTAMKEDAIGLHVVGQLAMKTVRGAEAHELMKMRAITGLSIGFVPREESHDRATGINTLKKVDLWEVSPVTFPANDAARIQGVKASLDLIVTIRDAECYLRDVGLGRVEAKAFIAKLLKCQAQRDADEDLTAIRQALSGMPQPPTIS